MCGLLGFALLLGFGDRASAQPRPPAAAPAAPATKAAAPTASPPTATRAAAPAPGKAAAPVAGKTAAPAGKSAAPSGKPEGKPARIVEVVEPQSGQRFTSPLRLEERNYTLVGVGLRKQAFKAMPVLRDGGLGTPGSPTPPAVPGAPGAIPGAAPALAPAPSPAAAPGPVAGAAGAYPTLRTADVAPGPRAPKVAVKPAVVTKPALPAGPTVKPEEQAYAMALYVDDGARISFPSVYDRAGRSKSGLLVESRAQHFFTWGHFDKLGVLRFLRDTSRGEIQLLFREGLEELLSDRAPAELRRDAEAFLALFDHDLKSGQEIRIHTADTGQLEVEIVGEPRKTGPASPKLCRHIWDIWLGYRSVSKEMRNSLIDRLDALMK